MTAAAQEQASGLPGRACVQVPVEPTAHASLLRAPAMQADASQQTAILVGNPGIHGARHGAGGAHRGATLEHRRCSSKWRTLHKARAQCRRLRRVARPSAAGMAPRDVCISGAAALVHAP
eukprot:365338-Chlamydomonas_euryale.AAC.41